MTDAWRLNQAGGQRLAERLETLAAKTPSDRRFILGLAGIAGAGKTTLAAQLAERIEGTTVIGLDAFHLPNATLRQRGLFDRKGAPETYDARAFIALLRHYRDRRHTGPYPVYDRQHTHEPITAPRPIDAAARVLIAEGQFLLLDEPPWNQLDAVLDQAWLLDTPLEVAKRWIIARHTATGRTAEQAAAKYENDLRNARRVLEHMRKPDLRLCWP